MNIEKDCISLDDLTVLRRVMQLPTGEVVECIKSQEGYWYYQVPALDGEGNQVVDENDDAILEKIKIAA